MSTKKEYETPTLTEVGSFEEITKGNSDGENLDATFPINTPKSELLFS